MIPSVLASPSVNVLLTIRLLMIPEPAVNLFTARSLILALVTTRSPMFVVATRLTLLVTSGDAEDLLPARSTAIILKYHVWFEPDAPDAGISNVDTIAGPVAICPSIDALLAVNPALV